MRISTLSFSLLTAIGLSACTTEPVAPGHSQERSDTSLPLRLEDATASQVAETYSTPLLRNLDACFEQYKIEVNPSALMITRNVLDQFRSNYPYDGSPLDGYCFRTYEVRTAVIKIFESRGRSQAYPEDIAGWMPEWAVNELAPATDAQGIVGYQDLPLGFYYPLRAAHEANARALESNPTGVDLGALRDQWKTVGSLNLDKEYFNPIVMDRAVLDGPEIWAALRDGFPIGGLSYVSAGHSAVQDFWNAQEGPEGDPDFASIAQALKKPSVRKRFFFSGAGSSPFGWSSNILIVVDEHDQVYGLQMGYSE